MASANSTTPLSPSTHYANTTPDPRPSAGHSDLLVAFLKVGLSASGRALLAADCPDVVHLVGVAHENLLAAHDLIQTDRELAA